jgi:epoxide hydrolase-like predicted phosphatase
MKEIASPIRAVIFDMGGVLLRTENLTSRTNLARKFSLTRKELENIVFQSPESLQAELGEFSGEQHWLNMAKRLKFPPQEVDEFQRAYWEGDRSDSELEGYIRKLRPRYRTGLLSNAWHGTREKVVRLYTFLTAFDVVIFSADVHLRKPDPRIFHLMIARLGVKAHEAVFVDDFLENLEGAQAVGLKTILFKSREETILALKEMGVK